MENLVQSYVIPGNESFPNSRFPVLHYRHALNLPAFLPALAVKTLFRKNNWGNNWRNGIYTFHHYHSITHEAIGVIRGSTMLQLGGQTGTEISIEKGDVIIIPAGVAHRNMGKEKDVICVGGYPDGKDFDMNYGKPQERPRTDKNIELLPIPATDPLTGTVQGLPMMWEKYAAVPAVY